ncbi:MAG: Lacal_2735 family protein [Saprospiraceae bacterium]|nr:Lacal_2735 family protein [Saprospiraceae bacterium]MBK8633489.1 Lacal_2735 family protein [Saprospiraceae bacterium]MBP7643074.1 Lacal_2735 family protein [Saprospiraceae bacterium]HMS70828.1 Lacal_2735 family protein [Saprospiraceae bacterium]
MFNWFKKKSEKEILQDKYKALLEESYKLSTTDRRKSDLLRAEADEISKQIDAIE